MHDLIINIINTWGYIGIFLLILLENLFPPIPSEIILSFGGYASTLEGSKITIVGIAIVSTIGSVFGAILLYYIGTIFTPQRLEKFSTSKLGKFLGFKKEDVQKAEYWFNRLGTKAVFLGRFIPIVRSLVSIPAGMTKLSMKTFIILTAIGSLIWNTVLILLGHAAGKAWEKIGDYINMYQNIVIVIGIIIGLGILYFLYKRKKKEKNKKEFNV